MPFVFSEEDVAKLEVINTRTNAFIEVFPSGSEQFGVTSMRGWRVQPKRDFPNPKLSEPVQPRVLQVRLTKFW